MDIPSIIQAFSEVGPAVASIIMMGGLSWLIIDRLLKLFDKHTEVLNGLNTTLQGVKDVLAENVEVSKGTRKVLEEHVLLTNHCQKPATKA